MLLAGHEPLAGLFRRCFDPMRSHQPSAVEILMHPWFAETPEHEARRNAVLDSLHAGEELCREAREHVMEWRVARGRGPAPAGNDADDFGWLTIAERAHLLAVIAAEDEAAGGGGAA